MNRIEKLVQGVLLRHILIAMLPNIFKFWEYLYGPQKLLGLGNGTYLDIFRVYGSCSRSLGSTYLVIIFCLSVSRNNTTDPLHEFSDTTSTIIYLTENSIVNYLTLLLIVKRWILPWFLKSSLLLQKTRFYFILHYSTFHYVLTTPYRSLKNATGGILTVFIANPQDKTNIGKLMFIFIYFTVWQGPRVCVFNQWSIKRFRARSTDYQTPT